MIVWGLGAFEQAQAIAELIEELWLDQREEECWRMFGIEIQHIHDERIITP